MQFFRWFIFLLLLGAGVSFVFYALTGQLRFRRYGLYTVTGLLVAGFIFFGILILQQWS